MKHLFIKVTTVIAFLIALTACRKDFDTIQSSKQLFFSTEPGIDTLYLDTVFNNLTTQTFLLRVYNRQDEDINIPIVQLKDPNSKYRLNVDGVSGKQFSNVTILENDSIFVFIEATADDVDTNSKNQYIDDILFDTGDNQQSIALVTQIETGTLLGSIIEPDFELTETVFKANESYVIYGNASVAKNSSLTIEAGAKVFFNRNAHLTIPEGSTLNINGTLENPVILRGNNLSFVFDDISGQWDGITVAENANAINVNYCKVFNASTAFELKNNQRNIINNTEIYNTAFNGIKATNSQLSSDNLVIGDAGQNSLFLIGGEYNFNHATFANFWNNGFRGGDAIKISNREIIFEEGASEPTENLYPLEKADFNNCIITGSRFNEFGFGSIDDETSIVFKINNSLVKLRENTNDELDYKRTNNTTFYNNIVLNEEEDFRDIRMNDFRIGLDSKAIGIADISITALVNMDIIGTSRTTNDAGAYQHIDFETLEEEETDKEETDE